MATQDRSVRRAAPLAVPLRDQLRARRAQITRLAARYGARNVRLFGSVARGEERKTSDVDILVDMAAGRSLMDLAGLALDLEELIGRRVDVFTPTSLKERVRAQVLREAVLL
jgi:uncharacterized protein